MVLIGIELGLIAALVSTLVLSSLVYGVSTTDPLTMFSTAVLQVAAAGLASWAPAMRAASWPQPSRCARTRVACLQRRGSCHAVTRGASAHSDLERLERRE